MSFFVIILILKLICFATITQWQLLKSKILVCLKTFHIALLNTFLSYGVEILTSYLTLKEHADHLQHMG